MSEKSTRSAQLSTVATLMRHFNHFCRDSLVTVADSRAASVLKDYRQV